MKGIIIEKGFKYYTDMSVITAPIKEEFSRYNWLITDCECNHYPDSRICFNNDYVWISGEDFLGLVAQQSIQFIWSVFSAFSKDIPLNEILKYDWPYADGYTGFWKNPISIQHPLAVMEIVPWDSSLVLAISKDGAIIDKLSSEFPQAEDLEQYNAEV